MRIIRLTPDQARAFGTLPTLRLTPEDADAVGRALARAGEWFRRIWDQLRALARRIAEAIAPVVRQIEQLRPALARPDRPAWASPYGPPPRGRR